MIVIKINEPISTENELRKRAEFSWKITPKKIKDETHAIVVFKGTILEEYKIINFGPVSDNPGRIAFNFSPVPNSKLKGFSIDYPTSYPCTVTKKLVINVC